MQFFRIIKKRIVRQVSKTKNTSYLQHKELARTLIIDRLHYFNATGEFVYHRVAIRDQRRCWGSCSSKGNLNFSYKLLFLPPCLRDYILVHELCHLKVLNHSASFWQEVEKRMPDYVSRMKHLRMIEKTLGTSIVALKKHQAVHTSMVCEACGTVGDTQLK